jgi:hypothetical protein
MTAFTYLVVVATLALVVQIARLVLAVKTYRRRFPRGGSEEVGND